MHDRYRRRLADTAAGGRPVAIWLLVRRFRCLVSACPRRTFAEQIKGLTYRYGRRSVLQRSVLEAVSLALAGRAGARLAKTLGATVNGNTLLRLLRALPAPGTDSSPRVLGVDDFALRRGHVYATVLIDIETGRPVDVLPDRTAETLTAWLNDHPGAEIVCRDRASAYAEAVRTAVPDAVQVADRFHVWKNLGEAVERSVAAHRTCLKTPVPEPAGDKTEQVERPRTGKYLTNTHERHAAVHQLSDKGVGTQTIAKLLHLDPKTVRRYAQAATSEELIVRPRSDTSPLRRYQAYLTHRWSEGCTDTSRLHAEIRELGYRGSDRTVRRWIEPLRALPNPGLKVSDAPTVRQVNGWLTRHPDSSAATRSSSSSTSWPAAPNSPPEPNRSATSPR
ncbi:ISL3 family transposase [Kitasatospora sp. NPDC127067]|uniref:ISL3 family transposase n=1 Tax=Kitasatospora sp. NPDC127067 TaxID=3347126 RepID=UPI00364FD57D